MTCEATGCESTAPFRVDTEAEPSWYCWDHLTAISEGDEV